MEQNPLAENIFNINAPSEWTCRVRGLANAHSVLYIDIIHKLQGYDNVLTVTFRKVLYYSGWLSWEGANFIIFPENDKKTLMENSTMNGYEDFHDDYTLFGIKFEDGKDIRILANAGAIFDKDQNSGIKIEL
jgi:hypothetical protein